MQKARLESAGDEECRSFRVADDEPFLHLQEGVFAAGLGGFKPQ